MKQKKFGNQGIVASEIGLGCMGMSEFYGYANDQENIRVLHHALEIGVTFWDTADMYGPYTNEILLGKAFKGIVQKLHWPLSLVLYVAVPITKQGH